MKFLPAIAVAALLFSSGAFAQDDSGQALTGIPSDGTKNALEVVIDGQAAKNIYQSMTTLDPITLGQGAMVIRRGANMSCYASIPEEMYLCVFQVHQDGTTKGRY